MNRISRILYIVLIPLCLFGPISPPLALFLGLVFALLFKSPYPTFNKKISKYLLQISVVGLGFGMNLMESVQAGADGIVFTIISVVSVLFLGIVVGKLVRVDPKTSYLIASGTAICGGSAIAAVSPVAQAGESQISISLAIVFILNAIALFIFPQMGHWFNLSQQQFGVWAAIAIHDTSSVVGAGAAYGMEALKVATTVKLTRALWIIPLSIFTSFYFKSKGNKVFIPWFILFFILAMLTNTYLPLHEGFSQEIVHFSRRGMTLTLFFIGAGLSPKAIKEVGFRSFLLGVILWIFIGLTSLLFVYFYY